MKWVLAFFGCCLGCYAHTFTQWNIYEVDPQYLPHDHFVRLAEYFTNQEDTGINAMFRSHSEVREGMYFVVSINHGVNYLPENTHVELKYYIPGDPKLYEYAWLWSPVKGKYGCELWLGVTGKDWPSSKDLPTAWSVNLIDPQGKNLAHRESFLWK